LDEIQKRAATRQIKGFMWMLVAAGYDWTVDGWQNSSVSDFMRFVLFGDESGYGRDSSFEKSGGSEEAMTKEVFIDKIKNPTDFAKALYRVTYTGDAKLTTFGWRAGEYEEELKLACETANPKILKKVLVDLVKNVWPNKEKSWGAFSALMADALSEGKEKQLSLEIKELLENLVNGDVVWEKELGDDWKEKEQSAE
jgi:hypothetical protein